MELIIPSLFAIVLYLSATAYTALQIGNKLKKPSKTLGICLLVAAIFAHTFNAYGVIITEAGIDLGFFRVASLIFWFISLFTLSALLRGKPIDTLVLILLPLAALSIMVSISVPSPYQPKTPYAIGLLSHIIISILSYSVLFIASIQAVCLAIQEKNLKSRHMSSLIDWLPSLQTMEELLFEMLWIGIVLLSASIISGGLFLDDLFAQHLVHKTVFSIAAWGIFAILLWGRHQLGWRGRTAVKWTIGGFAALMLAYFGSKLVLELLLKRF